MFGAYREVFLIFVRVFFLKLNNNIYILFVEVGVAYLENQ
jgi:hypothetical protein